MLFETKNGCVSFCLTTNISTKMLGIQKSLTLNYKTALATGQIVKKMGCLKSSSTKLSLCIYNVSMGIYAALSSVHEEILSILSSSLLFKSV